MKTELTQREAYIIELMHLLAFGSEDEMGLTLEESMRFLNSRVKSFDDRTVLEILETSDGRAFLDELRKSQ